MPLSTYLDADVANRARSYALQSNVALSTVIEAAVTEFLALREVNPALPSIAVQRRRGGRPSEKEREAERARIAASRKRRGRPLQLRPLRSEPSPRAVGENTV